MRREISFSSGDETLVGELTVPDGDGPFPTVVFVSGTGPSDRHQQPVLPAGEVIRSEPLGWLSDSLASVGIAAFAWDKRGVGASTGGARSPGDPPGDWNSHTSIETDVADSLAAIRLVAGLEDVDTTRITVMGHSAGVYHACLLAEQTDIPDSYVLWGGVHRGIVELMEFIYGQVSDFAASGPEQREYAMTYSPGSLTIAKRWREIVEAANRGDDEYVWTDDGGLHREHLARLKQELARPLGDQFRNIRAPVLIVHGDRDLNVPVDDAWAARDALEESGNTRVTLVVVPGADHGMRVAPADLDEHARLELRISRDRSHPVSRFFLSAVSGWILDQELLAGAGD